MYGFGDIRPLLSTGMAIQSKFHIKKGLNPSLFTNFTQLNHTSLHLDDSPISRNEAFFKTLVTRTMHVIIQNLDLTLKQNKVTVCLDLTFFGKQTRTTVSLSNTKFVAPCV